MIYADGILRSPLMKNGRVVGFLRRTRVYPVTTVEGERIVHSIECRTLRAQPAGGMAASTHLGALR